MASRLDLQAIFEEILASRNVYFSPPASVQMSYPAIRYKLTGVENIFANGGSYIRRPEYEVILIDKNPESPYFDQILSLPYCRFVRSYVANNLNHFVFNIYN